MGKELKKARDWDRREVEYVFDGYLPRKMLAMAAGKRGDGKSLLAAWIASQVSTGSCVMPDGKLGSGLPPGRVWYNTMEDDPSYIVRPRLEAVGADLDNVWLTDWHLELPNDAAIVRDTVVREHYDLVVLDSMQQHLRNPYHGFRDNRRAMDLMFRVAKEANCSILFIHHFNKGKTATVEAAIGGQGVIQNPVKAIYVVGQTPATYGSTTRFFANDRINAKKPKTLAFELVTKKMRGIDEPVPYLDYSGFADVTAWDVYLGSKREEKGSGRMLNVESSAEWLTEFLAPLGDKPVLVRKLEAAAEEAGRYYSRSTFSRARQMLGIEPVGTQELRRALGEEFDWLTEDERPPRGQWCRIPASQDGNDQLPKEEDR